MLASFNYYPRKAELFMVFVVAGVVVLLLIAGLITAFWSFDQLLRLQYTIDKPGWEQDGQPCGFLLWTPPEATYGRWKFTKPSSIAARNRSSITCVFTTPPWMRQNEYARTLLWQYRLLVLLWNVAGIVILLLFRL